MVARGELRSSYYEFYSYLSMGIFSRSVEEELRVKFPQAYKIYRELLERSQ